MKFVFVLVEKAIGPVNVLREVLGIRAVAITPARAVLLVQATLLAH